VCFVFLLVSTLMQFNNGHYFSEFTFTENEGCVWKWGTMEQNWTCYWIYFGFDLVYMTWNLPKNLHLCILLQSGLNFLFQKMRFGGNLTWKL
jgi:hypothetical protein